MKNMITMNIDLEYIRQIAQNCEGVDVEFKETTGQLNRGMESLCGMLNGEGGIVIFGVTNRGKIVGQTVADKTTREIGEALKKFDPSINVQPSYIQIGDTGKYVIAFQVDGTSEDKPYLWDGTAYQRFDSVTSIMPREKLLRLREQVTGLTYKWESATNTSITLDQLDQALIESVIQGAIRRGRLSRAAATDSIPTALGRLKLMQGNTLNNAAIILFAKAPQLFPQCTIRLARFRGNDKIEFIDNQRYEGNIFEMLDVAMAFFFKHLSLSSTTHNRIERKDELEVPYDALREAVVNALCHRAWHFESSSIGIAIFDDRIEIENAGRFPAGITPSVLLKQESDALANSSLPPNPIIANVLFLAGLIENWGRGISLMFNECARAGIDKPVIIDDGIFVKVVFKRQQNLALQTEVKRGASKNQAEMNSQIKPDTYPAQVVKLVDTIGYQWLSAKELCVIMGFRSRNSFRINYLRPAVSLGLISLSIPNSPQSPYQKYGLSELGRQIFSYEHPHLALQTEVKRGASKNQAEMNSQIKPDTYPAQVVKLVDTIGYHWLSAKELCVIMGFRSRNSFRINYLQPAVSLGLISLSIPNSPQSPYQKYGLTEIGKALLNRQR